MGNTLAEYPLTFEDIPAKQYNKTVKTRVTGGKDSKMSKEAKAVSTPAKKYAKTRGEHIKDLIIVALVFSVIAFGLGVKFQSDRNTEMQNAVKAATASAVAPEAPVKK